ncbi:energy transducer TonB [Psychroserpens mesophilus]|uniref:energy transducer TonB n=1 Tax=Psychroserpens mesophilus TaxID=325473 RepID=UPI003D6458DF
MKYFIFSVSFLLGALTFGQDKTISLSELDSITNKSEEKTYVVIENVPVYKGCKKEKDNANKKKCMSEKIAQLFQDNFNTELHEDSDIEPGMKQISVLFQIDKEGHVININAKGEDEYLEAEAVRVVNLIPQMTPGMQKGKPVIVPYSLPLNVNVTTNKNEGITKYPVYRGCDKTSSNKALEECSKRKIMNFIKMSFDIEMASRALPLERSTQFLLEFTINKKGKIENVNAKANHRAIAIEAIKVAKRLPKFKEPGLWEGVAVETPFSMLMTLYFQ